MTIVDLCGSFLRIKLKFHNMFEIFSLLLKTNFTLFLNFIRLDNGPEFALLSF